MKKIFTIKTSVGNYRISPKKGIPGRPDRFVQVIFSSDLFNPFDKIINSKSKKDITHKYEVVYE